MCGISLKDKRTNEELRKLVGVEPITIFIRSGRLRWYGHVMRKGDEDWVKKCMEYRVEGRRPVERPGKTWLESVEVDMAKLEIDKEDVHDRSNWRRNVTVMKRKSKPIGKTDYKPIIYLCKYDLRKGDLFVLSWARVRQVRRGSISSELLMCGGGVCSILLLPLVARCLVVVCHNQVRLQVCQGFRCRDS